MSVSLVLAPTTLDVDRPTRFLEIPTFLIAGHETTSTALTWTLFGLSVDLEAQRKLREELLTLNTDSPTTDDLKALKYIDMVVREALRALVPNLELEAGRHQGCFTPVAGRGVCEVEQG